MTEIVYEGPLEYAQFLRPAIEMLEEQEKRGRVITTRMQAGLLVSTLRNGYEFCAMPYRLKDGRIKIVAYTRKEQQ